MVERSMPFSSRWSPGQHDRGDPSACPIRMQLDCKLAAAVRELDRAATVERITGGWIPDVDADITGLGF